MVLKIFKNKYCGKVEKIIASLIVDRKAAIVAVNHIRQP
jgi:hypothetical protein